MSQENPTTWTALAVDGDVYATEEVAVDADRAPREPELVAGALKQDPWEQRPIPWEWEPGMTGLPDDFTPDLGPSCGATRVASDGSVWHYCTRELGHGGDRHSAGDGVSLVAEWPIGEVIDHE